MPWTPEQKKLDRVREKALNKIFQIAAQKDLESNGERYKAERLSYTALAAMFMGLDWREYEEAKEIEQIEPQDDDDLGVEVEKRGRKKKVSRTTINPSSKSILCLTQEKHKTVEELIEDFYIWLDLRHQCRSDLYFLGKKVFRKDLRPEVHQIICDQFVQKDFTGAFPKGYTFEDVKRAIDKQQRFDVDGRYTKELLLLDSRGFFKSTLNCIDCVQWLINCPDVCILLVTSIHRLSVKFLKEVKEYLYLPEKAQPGNFHLLFPEYVVRGIDGTSKEPITLECRGLFRPDASLDINSIDSSFSGGHCDVMKSDDVVSDSNSNNIEVREALKLKYDGIKSNVLMPWGFCDTIGTRYYTDDWYGERIKTYQKNPDASPMKYFRRAAWTVKPEYREVPLKELSEDMVDLTFPSHASFTFLKGLLLENEISFRGQRLNEPAYSDTYGDAIVTFTEDKLRPRIISSGAVPKDGEVFVCWDWALTANKTSDYSVGVAAKFCYDEDKWKVYILEIIFGKWVHSELALQIVLFNKRWNPKSTLIEASPGSTMLWEIIKTQARNYGVTMDVPIFKPPALEVNAKRNRIKGLETLLTDGRLWFVSGSWLDETFHQLILYKGTKKNNGRKDDIPDAMSYLLFFLRKDNPIAKDSEEAMAFDRLQRDKLMRQKMYDRVFGSPLNPLPTLNPVPEQGWQPRWPTK